MELDCHSKLHNGKRQSLRLQFSGNHNRFYETDEEDDDEDESWRMRSVRERANVRRANETPEEKRARLDKNSLRIRLLIETESKEQRDQRREMANERVKKVRQRRNQEKKALKKKKAKREPLSRRLVNSDSENDSTTPKVNEEQAYLATTDDWLREMFSKDPSFEDGQINSRNCDNRLMTDDQKNGWEEQEDGRDYQEDDMDGQNDQWNGRDYQEDDMDGQNDQWNGRDDPVDDFDDEENDMDVASVLEQEIQLQESDGDSSEISLGLELSEDS